MIRIRIAGAEEPRLILHLAGNPDLHVMAGFPPEIMPVQFAVDLKDIKIADETGEIDTAIMPRLYRSAAPVLLRGTYIRFNGKISQEGSMILDEIRVIPKK